MRKRNVSQRRLFNTLKQLFNKTRGPEGPEALT